jgi:uncharacterized protein YecE (DUF72 family)
MGLETVLNPEDFQFRNLHPKIFIGTASDRYSGWIGQIYSEDRYRGKITGRSKSVGKRSFREEVLPVESVGEYFRHFSVLELDFTFYSLLLDKDLKATRTFHVLRTYRQHLTGQDRLILKVPQAVFAQRLWRGGKFLENPDYLNGEIFTRRFYEPATELLGDLIKGFIFEQEYQPSKERMPPKTYSEGIDTFLEVIPRDDRYHIEVRTESLLSEAYFRTLERHGVGQVLSHWTWLPPLRRQFARSGRRFFNAGGQCMIRLMTPLGVRYEEAYAKAHPFDKMVEGMLSPGMIEDTVQIMKAAVDQGLRVNVISNNRAGGNAPMIARMVVMRFLRSGAGTDD